MRNEIEKQGKLIIQGQYIGELLNDDKTVSKFRLLEVKNKNQLSISEELYLGEELIKSVKFKNEVEADGVLTLTSTKFERTSFSLENIRTDKHSIVVFPH